MNTRSFTFAALILATAVLGCTRTDDRPEAQPQTPMPSTTTVIDSAALERADWDRFKLAAEQRIAAIEDSLALYDETIRRRGMAAPAQQHDIHARIAAMHKRLAYRDEAVGSFKRAGEAITKGIDTIGAKVSRLVSAK